MKHLPKAVINGNEIRCPVCNRLHFRLTGNEVIKNLVVFCRGRNATEGKHEFLINYQKGD